MLNLLKKIILGFFLLPASLMAGKRELITMTEDNTIVLRGDIDNQTIAKLSLDLLSNKNNEIILYINSQGGSVAAGMQFINIMLSSGKKINCIASIAASMAFVILQACTNRYVLESSILMQHVASYGLRRGDAPNNLSFVKFIEKMLFSIDRAQAKRLGMSVREFRAKIRDDWWLLGINAVKEGAADKIVNATCSLELTNKTYMETIRFFIFTFKVTWSSCPLIEEPLEIEPSNYSLKKEIVTEKDAKIYNDFLDRLSPRKTLIKRMSLAK